MSAFPSGGYKTATNAKQIFDRWKFQRSTVQRGHCKSLLVTLPKAPTLRVKLYCSVKIKSGLLILSGKDLIDLFR